MRVERQDKWIDKDTLGAIGEIHQLTDAREELRFGKKDFVLYLRNRKNEVRKSSCFGDNLNRLIDKFGTETEGWLGKNVLLSIEEDPTGKKFLIIVPS